MTENFRWFDSSASAIEDDGSELMGSDEDPIKIVTPEELLGLHLQRARQSRPREEDFYASWHRDYRLQQLNMPVSGMVPACVWCGAYVHDLELHRDSHEKDKR